MIFSSREEAIEYYMNYARCMGFGVTKISTKNGDDGKKYFTLACNRGKKYVSKSKNLLKPNPITKTQCKARLNACIGLDGTVTVSRVFLEHNHDLSPTKARYFRCNKNLEPHIKRRLELNDQAGINVSRNFRSLVVEANGYENLTFGERDCRNYIDKVRRLRLGIGDAEAIQNYFVRMQKQNSQFYYVIDVDDKSRLRNVFWADARCRAAYEYFGEVVTFDTTYLTNKYDMSFAPFGSFNTVIACVSHFGFESQFQKSFTNAKFKEFQVEVASMMYCHACFERLEGLNSIFSVTESKKIFDKTIDIMLKVSFNEKEFELQCTCCLFQFKGILCRHIHCVLKLTGKTESVPSYYIFSQWRKDIRRRHTLIKCGFDHLVGNVELQRVDKACGAFYEVASMVIHTDHDLLKAMNWINDFKNDFTSKETSPGIIEEDSSIQNQATKILDPVVTRSKGRPPSKRKSSKVDQIVKKKVARKRTQKSSQRSENYQSQKEDLCASRIHESENEGFLGSQIIDRVGTQVLTSENGQGVFNNVAPFNPNQVLTNEVNQLEQSYFWRNGYDTIKNLGPFNPNQEHYVEVNQVPYYSQVMNHNATYLDLLQAQHHLNDLSSSQTRE